MTQFIVFGAGAIGCYVGGRLAAAGQRVTLVARERTALAISRDGLEVSDLDGFRARIPAKQLGLTTALPKLPSGEDCVVLLCVKGGATLQAATELSAVCAPGTPVLSLQNGVDNPQRITRAAPALCALAGMVPYNVVMSKPAASHRASTGSIQLQRHEITEHIAPIFVATGLDCVVATDMLKVQWGKLLLNLNNPVNALSDLPLREQLGDRDFRRVLAALQTEALQAMKAAGVVPAQLGSAAPGLLPHVLRLPNWLFERVAKRMLRIDPSARSSMWDDVQSGRVTEIDDLCGAVVRLGAQTRTPTPCNVKMLELMTDWRKGQRMSGAQLLNALAAKTPTKV